MLCYNVPQLLIKIKKKNPYVHALYLQPCLRFDSKKMNGYSVPCCLFLFFFFFQKYV